MEGNKGLAYKREDFDNFLSVETTNCLRGILAVIIVVVHLTMRTNILTFSPIRVVVGSLGYLAVAVFFFLSGYGLTISAQKKGDGYLESFLRKRILPYYLNYLILVIIYALLQFVVLGQELQPIDILTSLFWGGTIVGFGWYLQALLLFYIVYFLVFRFIKWGGVWPKYILYNIFLAIYCIVASLIESGSTWYESTFAISLGMLFAYKRDSVISILRNYYYPSLVLSFLIFFGLYAGYIFSSIQAISIFLKMLSAVAFSVFTAIVIFKLPINFEIFRHIGKYSYEIYVVQAIPMLLFHSEIIYISNDWLYCFSCIATILILSIVFHPIFHSINKAFREGRKNANQT